MQKASVLGVGIFSLAFVLFFGLGFESDTYVSLNDLEKNEYSVTSTTIPITVTSDTISPTIQELSSETQRVSATTSKYDYSGAGFVFPLLQKSYGIGTSVTTLNYDAWDSGVSEDICATAVVDESDGPFDGDIYYQSCSGNDKIYRLNSTTSVLTTWTIPDTVVGVATEINATGHVFFSKGAKVGLLNPFTDEITLWDVSSAVGWWHQFGIDPATNTIYGASASNDGNARLFSLNPETNVLKIWNVQSLCPRVQFGHTGTGWDSNTGKYYANQLQAHELCVLDPSNNLVTLYDSGDLGTGWTWHFGIDPTNAGHVYYSADNGPKVIRIDTITPETTVWTLTGIRASLGVEVDSAGSVWMGTLHDASGNSNRGIVRLVPSTDVVTEWDFGGSIYHNYLFPMANGTIWEVYDTSLAGNIHFVRLNE